MNQRSADSGSEEDVECAIFDDIESVYVVGVVSTPVMKDTDKAAGGWNNFMAYNQICSGRCALLNFESQPSHDSRRNESIADIRAK